MLYRGESGKVVALDDRCCHRAAPLSMGRIEGDDIRCMYHGMKFDGRKMHPDPRAGHDFAQARGAKLSGRGALTPHLDLEGDAEKADPELIVDYPPLADPEWKGMPAYMHYGQTGC